MAATKVHLLTASNAALSTANTLGRTETPPILIPCPPSRRRALSIS